MPSKNVNESSPACCNDTIGNAAGRPRPLADLEAGGCYHRTPPRPPRPCYWAVGSQAAQAAVSGYRRYRATSIECGALPIRTVPFDVTRQVSPQEKRTFDTLPALTPGLMMYTPFSGNAHSP